MGRKLERFKALVDHPTTHLLVGLVLVITGFVEAYDGFMAEGQGWRLRAHHAIMILGVFQVCQCLPHLIEGLERWLRALEKGRRPGGEHGD
jgi:hypothetical protein